MHTDPRTLILTWSRIWNNWLNKRFFYIIKSTLKIFWGKAFGNHNVKFTFDHVLSSFPCKWNYWSFYWLWFCLFLPSFLPSCKHLNLDQRFFFCLNLIWIPNLDKQSPTFTGYLRKLIDHFWGSVALNHRVRINVKNRSSFSLIDIHYIELSSL